MIKFTSEGAIGAFFDWLMRPIMYWLQGNFDEEPQRTHFWNNIRVSALQGLDVLSTLMTIPGVDSGVVRISADTNAIPRFSLFPVFHAPRFGGWKNFVVLEPTQEIDEWYVGWFSFGVGVSVIPIKDRVRVLVGPDEVIFFGVDKDGRGIPIKSIGQGFIGQAGEYAKVPLL